LEKGRLIGIAEIQNVVQSANHVTHVLEPVCAPSATASNPTNPVARSLPICSLYNVGEPMGFRRVGLALPGETTGAMELPSRPQRCQDDPRGSSDALLERRMAMRQNSGLTPEERAQITEIQDLLIDRYVALKEALKKNNKIRVKAIEAEIKELQHEKEQIEQWATV
jgi:hypothetical protein